MMKKLLLTLTAALALTGFATAEDTPDFKAILGKIDEQTNFKGDASAKVTIQSKKPGENDNIMQAQYFRRDKENKFMILILKPEVNKGQGYLKIEDNIIFYDPESRKFSKLTGSGNFQDSNAKNSDFQASSLANDYDITESGREKLQAKDTYVLTLKAKTNDVTYPKRKVWIEVSTNLLLKSEDYSLSDRLMRTSLYGKYVNIDGKFLATRMRFEDNLKKGEVTDLILENPSMAKLPDTVFTQAYLEKVNN
jgi:outer membrane lipoprotein-sorting protein